MRYLVCVKQVPDAKTVRFDREKGTLIRDGVAAVINPFDLHAIEAALQMRDATGGTVTVVSMGPPQAAEAIRDAIAMGADSGVLLSDRAFAGADTLATTYTLMKAVEKLGGFDVIFCGKQAIDGDTAQVGPGLAVRLGMPSITCVSSMEFIDSRASFRLKRMCEEGHEVVEAAPPLLITVLTTLNTPRLPSLKGKMKAKKAEVPVWGAESLGADPKRIGLAGSPTRVVSTHIPTFEAKREILAGSPEEQVEKLVGHLKKAGIIP